MDALVNKKNYRKPDFTVYGQITTLTQSMNEAPSQDNSGKGGQNKSG